MADFDIKDVKNCRSQLPRGLGVVLGRLVAEIMGSNPAYLMDVCLCIQVLCCPV
jgi:hypothetical protein